MSERLIQQIRNWPRTKLDVLYDEEGWKEGTTVSPAYIIRLWNMTPTGELKTKEIKLQPEEALRLGLTLQRRVLDEENEIENEGVEASNNKVDKPKSRSASFQEGDFD